MIGVIIPKSISSFLKYNVALVGQNSIRFKSRHEAESFVEDSLTDVMEILEAIIVDKNIDIQAVIEDLSNEFQEFFILDTKHIVQSSRSRLNKEFNIELSVPLLTYDSSHLTDGVVKSVEKNLISAISHWLQSLFISDVSGEKYYVVSLGKLHVQVKEIITQKLKEIDEQISQYLKNDVSTATNIFFENIDSYFENHRDSLAQALQDQKSFIDNQDEIRNKLEEFSNSSSDLLNLLKTKKEYVLNSISSHS